MRWEYIRDAYVDYLNRDKNPDKWEGGTVGGTGTLKDEYKDTWKKEWMAAWTIDGYYNPVGEFTRYVGNTYTNLTNPLVRVADMDDRDLSKLTDDQKARIYKRYNTNVIIHEGATVGECEYCGSKQTIPTVDSEKKMKLFRRRLHRHG